MKTYVIRRVLSTIPVLFAVSILVFSMLHLVPGDPVYAMFEDSMVNAETYEAMKEALGLNDPLYVQYFRYVGNVLRGDLGRSVHNNVPVGKYISQQIGSTIELAVAGLVFSTIVGIFFGVISAVNRAKWTDTIVMFLSLLGLSMPSFWMGLLFIIFFSFNLGILPAIGAGTFGQLIMPAIVVGLHGLGTTARLTRSSVLEILQQDYIRTARAKGLSQRVVLYKHALRNALLPVITVIGMNVGAMLGGAAVVETVFTRPGIGRIVLGAISSHDFPVIQGAVLMSATMFVFANLLVDFSYSFVDPRVRHR